MIGDFALQRQHMVEALRKAGIRNTRVLSALASVPRENFVDQALHHLAYADCALPIAMEQSISQPLMVAVMTQALRLTGRERVLEIGTGSGYQTAVLSRLTAHVYSVERYETLAYQAVQRIAQLAVQNVSCYIGDGSSGWLAQAPYDRILVTAAAPELPSLLLEQLAPGGMLVIPIGSQQRQELQVYQRLPWGVHKRSLGGCVFVPLIGQQGWQEREKG